MTLPPLCGVMPSRHPSYVISRAQYVVPALHSGSTWRVRCARWHRVRRRSNGARHTWYRPVVPWGPRAGGRGALLGVHAPVRQRGRPACVPESGVAQTGPEPKRCGTRVRRTPSWYRSLHHPTSETLPAVGVTLRSTSRDGPSSAPDDLIARPPACRRALTLVCRPPDRAVRRGLPTPYRRRYAAPDTRHAATPPIAN